MQTMPKPQPKKQPEVELEIEVETDTLDELEIESEGNPSILQYHNSDVVNVKKTMINIGFSNDEAEDFRTRINKENVTFERFMSFFFATISNQKAEDYDGVRISEDQYKLFKKMILDEF